MTKQEDMSKKTEAYLEGFKMGDCGYPQEHCKYVEDSVEYWDWIDGWNKSVDAWRDEEQEQVGQWESMLVRL